MNAPSPVIVADPREDALAELAELFWALRMHCEVAERFVALRHLDGLDLALREARRCLGAAIVLRREITNG